MQDSVYSFLGLCKCTVYVVAFYTLVWDLALAYAYIRMRSTSDSFKYSYYAEDFYDMVDSFRKKPKRMILCEILLVVGILLSPPVFNLYANTDIGSILEKESYKESYYVYIREDMNEAKAYKLKADIVKRTYKFEPHYYLEKVYWGNGGYLTYFVQGGRVKDSAQVYPGIEASVTDKQDKTYYVTLTKEKAK